MEISPARAHHDHPPEFFRRSFVILGLVFACALFSACNVRMLRTDESESDVALSRDRSWTFDAGTEASYFFDSTKIEFSSGVARLKASDQTDDSDACSGFGDGVTASCGGTFAGTIWDGTNDRIRLDQSGTPTNSASLDPSWTPQYSSIVSYWKLDNDVTDVKNANNGVVSGTMSYSTAAKIGTHTGVFNGTDTRVTVPASMSLRITGQLTLAAWIKLDDPSSNTYYRVISKKTNYNDAAGYELVIAPGLQILELSAGGDQWARAESNVVHDSNWHFFVATINGTTAKIYWDAVDVTTDGTANAIASDGTPFAIGGFGGTNTINFFDGQIDEVSVWNQALTASEVALIYSRQSAKFAGSFTSRVMDAFSTGQSWTTFSWLPALPFLKPLPDYSGGALQQESSDDYEDLVGSTGAAGADDLMTGLLGLWHLDEPLGTTGAGSVSDRSGQNVSGTPTSVTFGSVGAFHQAPLFNGTSSRIDLGNVATYDFGTTTSFTVSAWLKWNASSQDARAIGTGSLSASNGFALHHSGGSALPGRISFTIGAGGTAANSVNMLSSSTGYNDNRWHHVVARVDQSLKQMSLYVDGARVNISAAAGTCGTVSGGNVLDYSACASVNANHSGNTMIGSHAGTSRFWQGSIDEAAIWSRALDPKEIVQLYRRGGNRAKFQVRICTAADCSDDPTGANWKGPDGTKSTYFSELNSNTTPLALTGAVVPSPPSLTFSDFTAPVSTSRYFQYRAILESDDTGTTCDYGSGATWCSPEIKSTTAGPIHYDSSSPTIVGVNGLSTGEIASLSETLGASCATGIRYNLGVGTAYSSASWYYWNGSAWAAANGTAAQANPVATASAQAGSFYGTAGAGTIYFKAFLQSSGTNACELDRLDLAGSP